jgi:hypothetical protein
VRDCDRDEVESIIEQRNEALKQRDELAELNRKGIEQFEQVLEQRDELLAACKLLVADVECYCVENVASNEPCGHCFGKAAIANCEKGQTHTH